MWNSLRFAGATMAVSLAVGAPAAYFLSRQRRRGASALDALFMMPLGVSAVIMGFGFLVAFNRGFLDLRSSWLIVVAAHSLVAYPFVIRSLLPTLRGMPPQLREAAALLGALSSPDLPPHRPAHPIPGHAGGGHLRLRRVHGRIRGVAAADAAGVRHHAGGHLSVCCRTRGRRTWDRPWP